MLFVLDALTFLGYVGVLAFVHDPGVAADGAPAQPRRTAPCFATRRSSGSGG